MKKGTALNGAQTLHWFCMVSLYLARGSLWCVGHVACIEPMTPWILVVALTTMQWLRGDHDRHTEDSNLLIPPTVQWGEFYRLECAGSCCG